MTSIVIIGDRFLFQLDMSLFLTHGSSCNHGVGQKS